MWALRQPGPFRFDLVDVPEPDPAAVAPGDVVVEFRLGALCGSDSPRYRGRDAPGESIFGVMGTSMHELVGIVRHTRDEALPVGARVVGAVRRHAGLFELVVNTGGNMAIVPDDLDDVAAVTAQPVSTVLSALDQVPPRPPGRAVVLGLGPQGLLFAHILSRRGWHVTGVDRVDRTDVAHVFGLDEVVVDDCVHWAGELPPDTGVAAGPAPGASRPARTGEGAPAGHPGYDLVIDAIGHDDEVLAAAVRLVATFGHVVVYGLPDGQVVFPMWAFLRKNATLSAGTVREWRRYLTDALAYVRAHPELHEVGATHRYPLERIEEAFAAHLTPAAGRLKVVLDPPAGAECR